MALTMSLSEFQALGDWVLLGAFALSCLLGWTLHRTHFCTMGSISDVMHLGDWQRAHQWLIAIASSMLIVGWLNEWGLIDVQQAVSVSQRLLWLSLIVGGMLFGFGMVLASGCGAKVLVRMGTGNLKAWVVFLVMGLASFATIKGITAVLRNATVDRLAWEANYPLTLPKFLEHWTGLGFSPVWVATALALLIFTVIALNANGRVAKNWGVGVWVGVMVGLAWLISGHWGHVAEHPETLEQVFIKTNSNRMEAFTFVAPVAYTLDWLIYFSDANNTLSIGVCSVLGVVLGAHVSARLTQGLRWESFADADDLKRHVLGGVLMGVGGVTAMGCTFGQGLSALSVLSLGAFLALPAIVLGAVLAMKYQLWQLERHGG